MEVCSASGGGVLFVNSKVFIALCRPDERSLLNNKDTGQLRKRKRS